MNFLSKLFPAKNASSKVSHEIAIAQLLSSQPRQWIPLPVISEYTKNRCNSQCYVIHSRISAIRDRFNMEIENKVDIEGGVHKSYYRYNEPAADHKPIDLTYLYQTKIDQ